MMKNEKELAARGCLCVEPSSPECSVPYIVTDPKGELRHYEEKRQNVRIQYTLHILQ